MENLEEKVIVKCHNCESELEIPKKIYNIVESACNIEVFKLPDSSKEPFCSLIGKHEGFYISSCGGYYCNKYCQIMFTED